MRSIRLLVSSAPSPTINHIPWRLSKEASDAFALQSDRGPGSDPRHSAARLSQCPGQWQWQWQRGPYAAGRGVGSGFGAGLTYNLANGLGNLVVGYNEDYDDFIIPITPADRAGSHNLIVGASHRYPSSGGFLAGFANTVSDNAGSVSGGVQNTSSGTSSSVSGGVLNTASGIHSSVSGGVLNTASGIYSSVSGGEENTASGLKSSVSGGFARTAAGTHNWAAGALVQPN